MDKKETDKLHTQQDRKLALLWVVNLFQRYYKGESTDKERIIIDTWKPDNNKKRYQASKKQIEEGCDTIWANLSSKFGFSNINFSIDKQSTIDKISDNRRHLIFRYASIAAVFVLIIGCTYFIIQSGEDNQSYLFSENQEKTIYETKNGEIKQIELPDGTTIYINGSSKLSYIDDQFNKSQREVWLEEGEAFFEVTKNPDKPFIVHSGPIQTTVLGTSFNVKAYNELDENTVSVRNGKVKVALQDRILGVLTQNTQLTYHKKDSSIESGESDWEDTALWIDGRLVMKRANLKELKLRLKQHFNVNVEIRGNVLNESLFNSSFSKNASLQEVLEGIKALYSIDYDINGRTVILYN
jgi:ferric-dicitrate binding protein FerR (iron transport regulator)